LGSVNDDKREAALLQEKQMLRRIEKEQERVEKLCQEVQRDKEVTK